MPARRSERLIMVHNEREQFSAVHIISLEINVMATYRAAVHGT
jgi:hypothetical protein